MNPFPNLRTAKRGDLMVEEIKRWIVERRIGPGDKLPKEGELQTLFGVSKGTAREALKSLEVQGLVTVFDRSGRRRHDRRGAASSDLPAPAELPLPAARPLAASRSAGPPRRDRAGAPCLRPYHAAATSGPRSPVQSRRNGPGLRSAPGYRRRHTRHPPSKLAR